MLVFLFVISFFSTSSQERQLQDILAKENNFFHKINEDIHYIVNKIFSRLKIGNDMKKSIKNQQLTSMHDYLNKIIENSYQTTYKEVLNLIKNVNETKDFDTKTMLSLNEVMKETDFNFTKKTNVTNKTDKPPVSIEELNEFIKKIDSLTVDDFMKKENKTIIDDVIVNESNESEVWQLNPESTSFRRIFNGTPSYINNYPFMASVHMLKQFVCAGSIISVNFIITAASCLQVAYNNRYYRENPRNIFVRIGSEHTDKQGVRIPITELIFHPQYDPVTLKNNLLLLRMEKELQLRSSKKRVKRIEYDRERSLNNRVVKILGWGNTDLFDNDRKHPLTVANIGVYNLEECKNIYSEQYVTEFNFCAGYITNGSGACNPSLTVHEPLGITWELIDNTATIQLEIWCPKSTTFQTEMHECFTAEIYMKRDVGGPGVANSVLVGVISFGAPSCGASDSPTVFTKVGYYADWIDSIVKPKTINSRRSLDIKNKQKVKTETKHKQLQKGKPVNKEIRVLRQILRDLFLSNNTLLEDILYGEFNDGYQDVFNKSTKPTVNPLENRTLFFVPNTYIYKGETNSIKLTTSAHTTPINHPHNMLIDSEAPYRWKTLIVPHPTHPIVTYSEYVKLLTLNSKFGKRKSNFGPDNNKGKETEINDNRKQTKDMRIKTSTKLNNGNEGMNIKMTKTIFNGSARLNDGNEEINKTTKAMKKKVDVVMATKSVNPFSKGKRDNNRVTKMK